MCGICGVIQVSGEPRPVLAPTLDRMTDAMTHRGPDDRGTYLDRGVALGVRRLSIVDVEGGHQPFSNENGQIWAVQNGELYNHDELRAQLSAQGHRFRSRCDTEVIPHLYEREGSSFEEHLRGKFAIALWDGSRRRGVLARDRLGIKPLYYARSGDLLVFASELKSLLASGLIETDLDYEAIGAYLSLGFVPGPRTPLAAVSKLMPGHRLVIEAGDVRSERYWAYPAPPVERSRLTPVELAERLLAELEESVRLRLMSDVPLGAMLSGGLDSSVIVALMARNMREPVKTFSVGFAEAGSSNELADARLVARALGTDHHELQLSVADQAVDLPDLVWHLDEPLADLSALGFFALSELAARHVTVALSGQGADELLGGYSRHRTAALAAPWSHVPRRLRAACEATIDGRHGRIGRAAKALTAPDPAARQLALRSSFIDDTLWSTLARGPLAASKREAARRVVLAHANGIADEPLAASLYLDAHLGLVDDMLHYFDRASMAHSLEVRVPFLDHHVVEFCATVPPNLKVRRLTTKHLLKVVARDLIPHEIIDKRKIGFFNAAMGRWLQAQAQGVVSDYLLAPNPAYADMLDRNRVEQLVLESRREGSQAGGAVLVILMLEIWLSSFLPRALGRPVAQRDRISLPA